MSRQPLSTAHVDLWAAPMPRLDPETATLMAVTNAQFRRSSSSNGLDLPLMEAEALAKKIASNQDMVVLGVVIDRPKRVNNVLFGFAPVTGDQPAKFLRVLDARLKPETGTLIRVSNSAHEREQAGLIGTRTVSGFLNARGIPAVGRYIVAKRDEDPKCHDVMGFTQRSDAVRACLHMYDETIDSSVWLVPAKRGSAQSQSGAPQLQHADPQKPILAWRYTPSLRVPGTASGFEPWPSAASRPLPAHHPAMHAIRFIQLGLTFQGKYYLDKSSLPIMSLCDAISQAHTIAQRDQRPVRVRCDLFDKRTRKFTTVHLGEFAPQKDGSVTLRDSNPQIDKETRPRVPVPMTYVGCNWTDQPVQGWFAWFSVSGTLDLTASKTFVPSKRRVTQAMDLEHVQFLLAKYKRRGGYDVEPLERAITDLLYKRDRPPAPDDVAPHCQAGAMPPPAPGRTPYQEAAAWTEEAAAAKAAQWTPPDPTPAPTKPAAPAPEDLDDDLKAGLAALDAAVANYQARAYHSEPLPASEPAPEPAHTQDTPDPLVALEAPLDALPGMHPGPRRETTWEDIYDTSRVQVSPRDVLVPYTSPHGPISDDELIRRLENKLPVDAGQLTPAQYKTWTNWVVDYAIATTPE
jgi:hypothetical protein